jgi:hypothetical protein
MHSILNKFNYLKIKMLYPLRFYEAKINIIELFLMKV